MDILAAESTNLFVGTEDEPRQIVRVRVRGGEPRDGRAPSALRIEGARVRSQDTLSLGPLANGEEARLEIGVVVDGPVSAGETLAAEVVVDDGPRTVRHAFDLVVAEPGWRMFMVSHFHYDPVWWNTQAAYTETWGTTIQYRMPFQEPGLALVKAHLETARRDPDYKFVLAELDYLKPYWDAYPEDRAYIRQLLADDRLEFMGGTYNEPNTNLTSAESTIRNAIYGVGYQRDVLGGRPATAWQLDAFGHDPQFPGIMADAGVSSSSWARGPFHEWGPHWVRGPARVAIAEMAAGEPPRMQFATEFDWVAPSGRALLTSFMANHYSAGWWMDASTTLEDAETVVHALFTDLAALAATKNVLLPVGTDYSPPNKWLTAIHRDWGRRYVWPKFISALPREFFDAVRAERSKTGRGFTPVSRDMNPIYTGKDVSFSDTKQAQRVAENTLLAAEKFATIASLLGARYPGEIIDKAWRQLLFGAHHDGITGSESDQVYLDLLGGWREALEHGQAALDGALGHLGSRIDTTGDGLAVTVFNAMSWPRTDIARAVLAVPAGARGVELRDDDGRPVPLLVEAVARGDGTVTRARIAFVARDVPALGYRTWRAVPSNTPLDAAGWRADGSTTIENEAYAVTVDAGRGGAIVGLVDKRTRKQLIQEGKAANELLAYREYPNHPLFAEGPWHLTPDGRSNSSADSPATVTVESSPIGRRIVVEGPFEDCARRQEIVLWDGLERVEFATTIDGYRDHDRLFRIRFPAAVEGGAPVSEVGNAVVGRGFGFPNVDVARVPFTLDNPAYNWFGLGSAARVALVDAGAGRGAARASRAIGIAEVIVPDDPAQDDAVRGLVVALVRQGVTSTLSTHDGSRYGVLHIDSNLPDVRVAVGGPSENHFVARLLEASQAGYRAELDRQLAARGWARLWVPATPRDRNAFDAFPDLRGVRDLPVLVVAGRDTGSTGKAVDALSADLDDAVVMVEQPASLDGDTGRVEDYTVAVLNRGNPGFNVEPDGSLYLSLMRSCSGWPSGVWIDPPRRSVPDGSNFQFQHWSHTFDYALAGSAGDWRSGGIVRRGHDYNNPLIVRVLDAHPGDLPAAAGLLEVEPASVVLTVLKPAGNPHSRMAQPDVDASSGVLLRLYESAGRQTTATVRTLWPVGEAATTNVMEEASTALRPKGGTLEVRVAGFEIASVRATLQVPAKARRTSGELAPRAEPAQPVFSDYWLHNKGAAPVGYQPVTVQIKPSLVAGSGPFTVPVVVASERTDEASAGSVTFLAPPGWEVAPAERVYRLAPGAHLAFDVSIRPANGASAGRYFVAARIADEAGQVHEDVVRIDYQPGGRGNGKASESDLRSASLYAAVARALRPVGLEPATKLPANGLPTDVAGPELEVTLVTRDVRLRPGEHGKVQVRLRNRAASEIRGEAQVVSPHETWPAIRPWTQGFAVPPGKETTVTFAVDPPFDFRGGTWWALVKVMYFGRLSYTESVPIEVAPAAARVETPVSA
jgi:alpha-mannosidase